MGRVVSKTPRAWRTWRSYTRWRARSRPRAFEGNKAETATMIPMINDFMKAHSLDDVVVVADAGMISAANKRALEAAGLSYVLGSRTSRVPHVISSWHDNHPDQDVPDGLTLTQPRPAGAGDQRRDETVYYRYRFGYRMGTLQSEPVHQRNFFER